MTDLMERLDELSRSAVAAAVTPPIDDVLARADRRRRSHRRRSILVAAAVVAAVAVVGGLATASTHHTRVTTTDDQDHGAGPHLVPSVWPAGLDGPITTRSASPSDPKPLPAFVLDLDGKAAVTARLDGYPMQPPATDSRQKVTVGQWGGWTWQDGADTHLEVGVHPGWTLNLTSRVAGADDLTRIAQSFDAADDRFDGGRLPTGWSVADAPDVINSLASGGPISSGWEITGRSATNGPHGLTVGSRRVSDAPALVRQEAQLFPGSMTVEIGLGGVVADVGGPVSPWSTLVWAPSDHVVAVVTGSAPHDELVATARSARSLSDSEWAALEDQSPSRTVDDFRISPEETVVATGRDGDHRWLVSTGPPPSMATPSLPSPTTTQPDEVWLHLRFDDGATYFGGGSVSTTGRGYWREPRFVAMDGGAPLGLRDATMEIGGRKADTVAVDVPSLGLTYVFGLLPGRDTPEVMTGDETMNGTLPDGSPYESTSASGVSIAPPTSPSGG